VLMRKYGNTLETLKGVEAKVHDSQYVRHPAQGLQGRAVLRPARRWSRPRCNTVLENLTVGMVLVFLVLIFFLGNLRAAIIAAINIPLALCGAFALMHLTNTPANLNSLGAIDFGIIIDTTVIVMENIERHLTAPERSHESYRLRILAAAQEVGGPMFFSTLIFVIAFLLCSRCAESRARSSRRCRTPTRSR